MTKVYISLGDYSIERKGIDNLSDGGQDGWYDVNRSKWVARKEIKILGWCFQHLLCMYSLEGAWFFLWAVYVKWRSSWWGRKLRQLMPFKCDWLDIEVIGGLPSNWCRAIDFAGFFLYVHLRVLSQILKICQLWTTVITSLFCFLVCI